MANDSCLDKGVMENSKTDNIHPHLVVSTDNVKPADTNTQLPLKRSSAPETSATTANDPHLRSPAKKIRLEVPLIKSNSSKLDKFKRNKFIYGNYSRYYGYRNMSEIEDVRIVAFHRYADYFANQEILDIGCNYGNVTVKIAKEFPIKFITGLDIDKDLIALARKRISMDRKSSADSTNNNSYPFNVAFKQCNYVLNDEHLLELETEQFDTILCLSVTKWIHLNFGDAGLKRTFKRMYRQLRPGGRLILEPQDWKSYKKRKNLTDEIKQNYQSIKLVPQQFKEYLLSAEVGFENCFEMEKPEHVIKGFRRSIFVFEKTKSVNKANATRANEDTDKHLIEKN